MTAALSALLPSLVMAVLFTALVVTAARATDWSDRGRAEDKAVRKDEDALRHPEE